MKDFLLRVALAAALPFLFFAAGACPATGETQAAPQKRPSAIPAVGPGVHTELGSLYFQDGNYAGGNGRATIAIYIDPTYGAGLQHAGR